MNKPVTLLRASRALLRGLPIEDQQAIKAAVGTQMERVGTDAAGMAEVEFRDARGVMHWILVSPKDLAAVPN